MPAPSPPANTSKGTIYGDVIATDTSTPSGYVASAYLVGLNGYDGAFLLDGLFGIPKSHTATTDVNGRWQLDLYGNDRIVPAGSCWRVTQPDSHVSKAIELAAQQVIFANLVADADWPTGGSFVPPALFVTLTASDPNADRLIFWDDSAGAYAFLTAGSGLTISGTTITASGGGGGGEPALGNPASDGYVLSSTTAGVRSWIAVAGTGTVTSVAQSFTGGLISVAGSPISASGTLALTVAGNSGGVPYFSSSSTWASSAALAANAIVIGGGAGAAPATTTTGTGVLAALAVNVGSAGAFVVLGGALGTPSSGTLTNCTFPTLNQNTTGTAAIATTVTAANEAVDTSCSVLFVTAATGNLGPKTNAGLEFNSATGNLGSTTYNGVSISGGASSVIALGSLSEINLGDTAELTLNEGAVVSIGDASSLIVANNKTLTFSNTLTFTGTDGSTLNVGAGGTLGTSAYITLGTGVATALAVNVGSAGAPVVLNGAGGTPSSMTGTNITGIPAAGITGTALVAAAIDDTAYDATSWNGDTTHAPSKNAVRDKIESLSAGMGYTLSLGAGLGGNPADSTTYYFGADLVAGIVNTTYSLARIEIPKAGTIKRFFLKVRVTGTLGTTETVTHYVRLNDTTDVAQIDTTYDATSKDATNTSVSQAVSAGDFIAVKIVCPAWATNPTSVRIYAVVYIE